MGAICPLDQFLLPQSASAAVAFQDPEASLIEWEVKLALARTMGAIFVLFIAAILEMLAAFFFLEQAIPDHTLFTSWNVDWNALGYSQAEFQERQRTGFLWMVLTGIAYMVIVLGGYLVVTIRRLTISNRLKG